ncbi:MAG: glycine cleavage system protein H [Parachlamydiales bacterium]|jgi:glycine cleavage system H protein
MTKDQTGHEWIKKKGRTITVGLKKAIKEAIGEIVFLELPQVGRTYKKGEQILVLEGAKAAFDLYAPLTGKVSAVNRRLLKQVRLLNQDPEKSGWLYRMELKKEN